ncbi:MAG: efflux RND transporter periplasmic adaptor subunit [Candidatus Omnitrophota bacterium]
MKTMKTTDKKQYSNEPASGGSEPFYKKVPTPPKIFIYFIIIPVIISLSFAACRGDKHQSSPSGSSQAPATHEHKEPVLRVQRYQCPMHPTYISDKPGNCPICGMTLVPMKESPKPQEKQDKKKQQSGPQPGVQGLATVTVPPAEAQRLGLTYGTVDRRHLFKDIRTSARIVADETRQYRVSSRIDGWVEKLYVNVTGQQVKKNTPLLSIYSPELVEAQQELLTAVTMAREFTPNTDRSLSQQAQQVLNAARQRLKFWDITDRQIAQIETTGQVQRAVTLFSPASGFVSEKTVLPGQKIMAGESLMLITDLSHVWGVADIYESDMPDVKVGMAMAITIPNQPGERYPGKIAFLDPSLNPTTRTVQARIDIANKKLNLKPGMYADATLNVDLGEQLTIPASAVMRSGQQDYAFALGKDGELVPIEVKIGTRSNDLFELVSGLDQGDQVVTSANFLIDSESSLNAALQAAAHQH